MVQLRFRLVLLIGFFGLVGGGLAVAQAGLPAEEMFPVYQQWQFWFPGTTYELFSHAVTGGQVKPYGDNNARIMYSWADGTSIWYASGSLYSIVYTGGKIQTNRHITIGSPWSDVKKAYPGKFMYWQKGNGDPLYYLESELDGSIYTLGFFVRNGEVSRIGLYAYHIVPSGPYREPGAVAAAPDPDDGLDSAKPLATPKVTPPAIPKTTPKPAATKKPVLTPVPQTAAGEGLADYLTATENQVVAELNLARTDPAAYAWKLLKFRTYFKGDIYYVPGNPTGIMTNEGLAAVDEAVRFLQAQSPMGPLTAARGLSLAARDHARDQGATGATGHDGSDGSTAQQRMNRYGAWNGLSGENIDYGNNDAAMIVISLIVDDGVANRGHRTNIFNPDYARVGIAIGSHPEYRHMCVMDLAARYTDNAQAQAAKPAVKPANQSAGTTASGNAGGAATGPESADVTSGPLVNKLYRIEGGTFTMGTPLDQSPREEGEVPHQVTLASFAIFRYPVTYGNFAAFVAETGYVTSAELAGTAYDSQMQEVAGVSWRHPGFSQTDNHPVVCVSWFDSIAYANWKSAKEKLKPCYSIGGSTDWRTWPEGWSTTAHNQVVCDWTASGYRLPTEAEYEYAAKGGKASRGYVYAGSNNCNEVLWSNDNSNGTTHEVGSLKPNELGLYDMTGNGGQWCWDWSAPLTSQAQQDPRGPAQGYTRQTRGGCYLYCPGYCRPARRDAGTPSVAYATGGFRLVRNAKS